MNRFRALRTHWKPFWKYARDRPGGWPALAAMGTAVLWWVCLFLHDPGWVLALVGATWLAFVVAGIVLIIASYRRSLAGPALDRHAVHDRKDIWKDRWPR